MRRTTHKRDIYEPDLGALMVIYVYELIVPSQCLQMARTATFTFLALAVLTVASSCFASRDLLQVSAGAQALESGENTIGDIYGRCVHTLTVLLP
jgi:hypothetical protein